MKKTLPFILFSLLSLAGYAQLIREPYLQAATPTSIVVRWRTDVPSTSLVRYGPSSNNLNQSVSDNNAVTEHEIKISGLSPKTRYFYSVGSSGTVFQGDGSTYFETTPVKGEAGKYRFGVLGDCGTNSAIQIHVRDQLINYLGPNYMNALLLLGDNAYSFGTDAEYQSNFFNHYMGNLLKRSPTYPAPGNHDYNNDNADRQNDHKVAYYDVFTMPKNGEAGGVASETEAYYSYDYGNVHFLSLDSYGKEDQSTRLYDTLGKQVQWVKADLAANTNKDWVVAYWHHPPYTMGTHNSDTENELIKIRENFIKILERYGVDLIICGHSHAYERSKLMKGHYDNTSTFNASVHQVSQSSGKYDGTENSCPYIKTSSANKGTVYVVAGSSGQLGGTAPGWPQQAMYYSDIQRGGSMILEVEGNRLDAKWIGEDGQIRDKFTIEKDVNQSKIIHITKGNSTDISASFIGQYLWNTGATTRTLRVSPTSDTDYFVKDAHNCINDVFHVKVTVPLPVKLIAFKATADAANSVKLEWTTEFENNFLHFAIEKSINAKDYVLIGQVQGTGNSTTNKSYDFTDFINIKTTDTATIYYRLKMVDKDGSFEYSRIVAVTIIPIILATDPVHQDVNIEIVPNPSSKEDVQIRLVGREKAVTKLLIMDVSGKILVTKSITLTKTAIPFLPSSVSAGTYFVKVVIDGKTFSRKLVVF